jgi:Domain of unknown function (DUF4399)
MPVGAHQNRKNAGISSMLSRPLFAVLAAALSLAAAVPAYAQDFRSPAPAGAKVYFIEPKDGAEITGPVAVKFGLIGMGVAPAGVEQKNTGHHHILVDQKLADPMTSMPADDTHRHFGAGETTLTLAPGKHTLQLVLGDHNHIPHNPIVASDVITITVK